MPLRNLKFSPARAWLCIQLQLFQHVLIRVQDFGVLVDQPIEVTEEGVRRSQEFELKIARLTSRKGLDEVAPATRGKEGSKLHDVAGGRLAYEADDSMGRTGRLPRYWACP